MKLVLFRHAEKQAADHNNPHLSSRGLGQAEQICEAVQQKRLVAPTELMSSPKWRARETLAPLAENLGLALGVSPVLDERDPNEVLKAWQQRILEFISAQTPDPLRVLFVCTHFDWIDEFLNLVPCAEELREKPDFSWAPTAHLIFEVGEIWRLAGHGVYR